MKVYVVSTATYTTGEYGSRSLYMGPTFKTFATKELADDYAKRHTGPPVCPGYEESKVVEMEVEGEVRS